jgi:hypothetical protein
LNSTAQHQQNRTEQNRTEQNRTEQNRTEQNRTEQNRTEQNRTEQNRTEHNRTQQYSTVQYSRPQLPLGLLPPFYDIDPKILATAFYRQFSIAYTQVYSIHFYMFSFSRKKRLQ